MKQKIVFLLPSLEIGGMEREVVQIVKYLNPKTFDSEIWLFSKRGQLLGQVPEEVTVRGLNRKSKWSFLKLIFNLRKLICQFQPDIIVQFTSTHAGFFSFFARLVSRQKVRLVVFIRNIPSIYIDHQDSYLSGLYKLIIKKLYPYFDQVWVNSLLAKEDLSKNFKLKKQIKVFPSTVDSQAFKKAKLNFKLPTIITVARLVDIKRLDLLIDAFYLVQKSLPLVKLLIIGDGPQVKKLKLQVEKLKIGNKVDFLGYQEKPEEYLSKADLFVITSRFEGIPHTILEAMASGLPIVATDFPGVETVVTNEEQGIIVSAPEPEILARAMIKIIESPDLAEKFVQKGLRKVKHFDIRERIKDYERIFRI